MHQVITESAVEETAPAGLESLGYAVLHLRAPQGNAAGRQSGPDISPGGDTLTLTLSQWGREKYSDVAWSVLFEPGCRWRVAGGPDGTIPASGGGGFRLAEP